MSFRPTAAPDPLATALSLLGPYRDMAPAGTGAGVTSAFSSYRASKVDDTLFPPKAAPLIVKLPKLPKPSEGPAPVVFASKAATDAGAAHSASQAMEHLWVVGFLDAQGKSDTKKGRVLGRAGAGFGPASGLAAHDEKGERDFIEASAEFRRLMTLLQDAHFKDEKKHLTTGEATAYRLSTNPLSKENLRIRRALVSRARRATAAAGSMATKAAGMDRLVLMERVEAQAAIVLQRWWRRELRARFWKRFLVEQRSAYNIQVRRASS